MEDDNFQFGNIGVGAALSIRNTKAYESSRKCCLSQLANVEDMLKDPNRDSYTACDQQQHLDSFY